ncbi:MAG: toll/interleukin-1 receptor domain-containing protein [Defluviitaleaceae bacterium]|nr:toll/interleukin-1 receptor domain-containing protein [Defluviitaleaceae bacterium]
MDYDNYTMLPSDLFICYSDSDLPKVKHLIARLEKVGLRCWFADRNSLTGGNDINLQMIDMCSVFLMVTSRASSGSSNMQFAASHAMSLGKPRLEYKIDDVRGQEQADALLGRQLRDLFSPEINQPEPDIEEAGIESSKAMGFKAFVYILILIFAVTGGVMTIHSVIATRQFMSQIPEEGGLQEPTLDEQARQGDMDAQYELGRILMIVQDFSTATSWFRQAAEQGHNEAMLALAINYRDGIGVRRNHDRAIFWFYQAGETHDPEIQAHIGWLYDSGHLLNQNYEQALYWYLQAARQDNEFSQVRIGVMFSVGLGTEVDDEQAVYWYKRAAAQGNAMAQGNLGARYAQGHGVEQSYEEAVYWFNTAALQGDTNSMVNLGMAYEFGLGVEEDYHQALHWYREAVELGNPSGINFLAAMYFYGRGVTQDFERAAYLFKQMPSTDSRAASYLGMMYEHGLGVHKDHNQAMEWYKRAGESAPWWVRGRSEMVPPFEE